VRDQEILPVESRASSRKLEATKTRKGNTERLFLNVDKNMLIGDLGEFGVIERIARLLPGGAADVVVGIGDDVAVLDTKGPRYLLATCDIQVEHTHFLRQATSPYQLGRKVIAINVSDIAAMGGRPRWALVSLALPPDTPVDFVDELYRGMNDQAQMAELAIVGGNLSKIDRPMVIDLCLLGDCDKQLFLRRSGAQVDDAVLVTGTVGDSRAGLELLLKAHLQVSDAARETVLAAHLTPQPRLAEGQLLAESGLVHAMLDVSDGILGDLRHICEASHVGATVALADLPVSQACREVARTAGAAAEDWALTGGEDYQLLFTAAQHQVAKIQTLLAERTGTAACVIGRILPAAHGVTTVAPDGTVHSQAGTGGWDHFKEDRKP
jgi:thiamine-monophosphate kinase